MKIFLLSIIGFLIGFLSLNNSPIYAANVEISNTPSSLEKDQEFEIQVALSGAAANTNNFLRAAFFHDVSPTSYFGYTYNHENNWYNGTPSPLDPHKFLQISISPEGSYSGTLKIKADLEDSAFKGAGAYNLKVGRYTTNGSSVSDWSNAVALIINAPSPTPTPIPTSISSSTPNPTNTPKPPTPTTIKSPSTIPTSANKIATTKSTSSQDLSVLGKETSRSAVLTLAPNVSPTIIIKAETQKSDNVAKILIGIGGVFILGAAAWIGITIKKQKNLNTHP